MRLFFAILLLSALLCKVTEPLVVSLRYRTAVQTQLVKSGGEEQMVVKKYLPLPYASDWEDLHPVQQSFTRGDEIYNVVERRYVNDTLYLKLQRNVEASAEFGALHTVVGALVSKGQQQQHPGTHISLDDLLKAFFIPAVPVLAGQSSWSDKVTDASIWHFRSHHSTGFLHVFAPPPEIC